ncbi:hypothetical protein CU098_001162, partial [Rhizopus stolonifer]
VIGVVNETYTMAVSVDNVTYPLSANDAPVLFTGQAPIAQSGYRYIKLNKQDNNTASMESFLRQPVDMNTVNEFFNISWNSRKIAKLPTLYEPLSPINRIDSQLHRDGEIPTIYLTGNQTEFDILHSNITNNDAQVMTNMTYISLNQTYHFEDVRVTLAGRSSTWMSKLSYNLKLKKKDRLFDYKRVKIRALATDPAYIREQLAYDVLKSVGLVSSEFSYCRVLLNNQEIGLFGIIDTFQNPWLANVFADGDKDHKNGYLYQGVFQTAQSAAQNHTSDLSYYDNITAYADGQYKIKVEAHKGKKDNFKPLMEFTKFVAEGSQDVNAWKKKLDMDAFLRSMALEKIVGYSDGYNTMADNYYLAQLEDGRFFWISSDMDMTWGSTIISLDAMWSGNYSQFPGLTVRPLMTQVLNVPEFKQQYEDLLVNITKNLVNPTVMNDRVNDLANMLREDVAWDQNLPRTNLLSQTSKDPAAAAGNSAIAGAVGSQLPPNFNMTVAADFGARLTKPISFETALNGPTGHPSLAGFKEWSYLEFL